VAYTLYTKQNIENELKNRFFPRQLIVLKNPEGFNSIFNQVFNDYLNSYKFEPRAIELPINGREIDLDNAMISTIYSGVKVGSIITLHQATATADFFNAWRVQFAGNPNFLVNVVRYNQDFKDFIVTHELYKQMQRKLFNKNTDWQAVRVGNHFKIIVGTSYAQFDRATIFFYPYFENNKIKILDSENKEIEIDSDRWLFTDKEYSFLMNCIEAITMKREARALTEAKIMGIETNADTYNEEGDKLLEKTLTEQVKKSSHLSGKRL